MPHQRRWHVERPSRLCRARPKNECFPADKHQERPMGSLLHKSVTVIFKPGAEITGGTGWTSSWRAATAQLSDRPLLPRALAPVLHNEERHVPFVSIKTARSPVLSHYLVFQGSGVGRSAVERGRGSARRQCGRRVGVQTRQRGHHHDSTRPLRFQFQGRRTTKFQRGRNMHFVTGFLRCAAWTFSCRCHQFFQLYERSDVTL